MGLGFEGLGCGTIALHTCEVQVNNERILVTPTHIIRVLIEVWGTRFPKASSFGGL